MKSLVFAFVTAAAVTAGALPSAENQKVRLVSAGDRVKVEYDLKTEDAVVTVQFFKNGSELINEVNYANSLSGDVNRKVATGNKKTIYWDIPQALRGNLGDSKTFTARLKLWPTNSPPTYMVVHLTNNPVSVSYYASTNAFPNGFGNEYYKRAGLTLRKIPAAGRVFQMGATKFEVMSNNKHLFTPGGGFHNVKLTEDYYIGVYEFTYGNKASMDGRPGSTAEYPREDAARPPDTRSFPVCGSAYTSWRKGGDGSTTGWPSEGHLVDAGGATGNLITRLNNKTGLAFDLPTEAQWIFACTGDGSIPFYNGETDGSDEMKSAYNASYYYSSGLTDYAWTLENSGVIVTGAVRYIAHEVGLKKPNSFGLYDMIGNVSEFVLDIGRRKGSDRWTNCYYETDDPAVDPKGFPTHSDSGIATPLRLEMGASYVHLGFRASRNSRRTKEQTYSDDSGDSGLSNNSVEVWSQGARVACPAMAIK